MEAESLQSAVSIKNKYMEITPLSKYLAMVLFVILPFVGGWVGYSYAPVKTIEVEKVIVQKVGGQSEDTVQREFDAQNTPDYSSTEVLYTYMKEEGAVESPSGKYLAMVEEDELYVIDLSSNSKNKLLTLKTDESFYYNTCTPGEAVYRLVWLDNTNLSYSVYEPSSTSQSSTCEKDSPLIGWRTLTVN